MFKENSQLGQERFGEGTEGELEKGGREEWQLERPQDRASCARYLGSSVEVPALKPLLVARARP